ncbi:MAG: ATP-binding protein [Pseudomonadota bacterium]
MSAKQPSLRETQAISEIAELVPGCFISIDPASGRVTCLATGFESLMGRPRSQFTHVRSLLRLCRNRGAALGAWRAAQLGIGNTQKVLLDVLSPDGQPMWIELRLRLTRSGSRIDLQLQDVTGERQRDINSKVKDLALRNSASELYVLDENGHILETNPSARANSGYSETELRSMRIEQLAPIIATPEFDARSQACYSANGSFHSIEEMHRKDGSRYNLESVSTQVRQFGKLWYVVLGWDVTEMQAQERALIRSEERLANAIRSSGVAIYDLNLEDDTAYVSDAFWQWLEIDRHEDGVLLNAWFAALVHPDDRATLIARTRTLLRHGGKFEFDYRLRRASGNYIWVRTAGTTQLANGRAQRMIGTMLNIDAQKRAEADRDDTAARLKAVLDSVGESILTLAVDGTIVHFNPAARSLLGARLQPGIAAMDLFEPPTALTSLSASVGKELQLVGDDTASAREVEAFLSPIAGSASTGYAFTLVIRDVSARKRHERSILSALRQAEEAGRAKSEFLAMMSHEIRTPMNGVMGMAQVLLDSPLNNEQRDAMRIIYSSGTALLSIINDVLDFSKVEAGRLELESAPFDLAEAGRDVMDLVRKGLGKKTLSLAVAVDPELPPQVLGDSGRVRQILLNLLGNAVKFTDEGRVELRLAPLATNAGGEAIQIQVIDTGIGMSETVIANLFQAFRQADASTTRRYGGTGLGLTISQRLAEMMGGTITVESEPGVGSCFTCSLRLPSASGAGHTDRIGARMDSPAHRRFSGARVLVVEDNRVNQTVARKLLQKLDCEVELAENGEIAIDRWQQQTFDLIFMDCQMPVLDGYDATRRIRTLEAAQQRRRVPIVAMTANVMLEDQAACQAAGMDDHAAKPVVLQTIADKLERWLEPRP